MIMVCLSVENGFGRVILIGFVYFFSAVWYNWNTS